MIRLSRKGHNLLEVTVAAFIFVTAVVLMIGIWGTYHQAINQNKNKIMAAAVARAELENCIATGYVALEPFFFNNMPAGQSFTFNFDSWVRGREVQTTFIANLTIYDCSLTAAQGGPPNNHGNPLFKRLCHVICNVYWSETGGVVDPATGNPIKSIAYDCYLFGAR